MSDKPDQSRKRKRSKRRVSRAPTRAAPKDREQSVSFEDIADIVGSVEGLPPDLSARAKYYLKAWGYGVNRRH